MVIPLGPDMPDGPLEHRFTLHGEPYLLVGWMRAGEARIRADLAAHLGTNADILNALDGNNLLCEAIARECLREAPARFFEPLPPLASQNGTPRRLVTFEHIGLELWEAFAREVDVFRQRQFQRSTAEPRSDVSPGAAEPDGMATAETVPAPFRGRAE